MGGNSRNPGGRRENLKRRYAIVVACLLLIEIVLRLAGMGPVRLPEELGAASLFEADSLLGYTTRPGYVEMPTGSGWTSIRHNADGNRAVEPADNYLEESAAIEVWFAGGSDVYGVDLPDRETIPWLLTDRLREMAPRAFVVHNLAVPGYSADETYLKMRQAIDWGQRPNIVILPTRYAETVHTRSGRYSLQRILGRSSYSYPIVRAASNRSPKYHATGYQPLPGATFSAILGGLDRLLRLGGTTGSNGKLLRETVALLQSHDVKVIVIDSTGKTNFGDQVTVVASESGGSNADLAGRLRDAIGEIHSPGEH